ncbi:metallophosphoesterase [Paenisporosarcina antarctica]|uniref:Metallophosphoesterase n=1 Tax=Paenisporosarcina antarctica TaxID=417367 RepID=A0A4P6ZUA1_9BACL|nr:metallophosphoesterase [Paenisporosarcina antarctica]QBP39664.1 metallophosphoesterase [Paenisporosarcina antarctica]
MFKKLVKYFLAIASLIVFLYVNNNWLTVSKYIVESSKIPASFDGYRIVQVSDLHDATFGENQQRLVNKIQQEKPDMIVITGDIIDSNRYDLQNSLDLIDQIIELAEVYYVTGNHEVATNDVDEIKEQLTARGVRVLSNETLPIERDGETISLTGIEDPLMGDVATDMIAASNVPSDAFTVLLAHRPEDFQSYVDAGIDVTLSGHAHGGQFRIPFVGGLVAPGQGYFPKFTAGIYEQDQSKLIVSRGLGNSIIPIRLFNLPEIVVVTLKSN